MSYMIIKQLRYNKDENKFYVAMEASNDRPHRFTLRPFEYLNESLDDKKTLYEKIATVLDSEKTTGGIKFRGGKREFLADLKEHFIDLDYKPVKAIRWEYLTIPFDEYVKMGREQWNLCDDNLDERANKHKEIELKYHTLWKQTYPVQVFTGKNWADEPGDFNDRDNTTLILNEQHIR